MALLRSTTILGVRHKGKVAMGGDGQVSMGGTVMKHRARKVHKLYQDRVVAGFAGASADAVALLDRFEAKLEEFRGNLMRSAVELAKEWRTDRALRRLEALMAVADLKRSLIISGEGDVIEPDDGIVAVGSGAGYAIAAARAYLETSKLNSHDVVEKSLRITASICLYTNTNIIIEDL